MNDEILGLLGIKAETAREKALGKGFLTAIAQAAALSGPQARPVGNLQGAGQVLLSGIGGYESAMDKTITDALKGIQVRQALASANAPRLEKVKDASGAERFVLIPASVLRPPSAQAGGATPSGVPVPTTEQLRMLDVPGFTTEKPIDFDAPTRAFIDLKFGGRGFSELRPNEKAEVLQFQNAPNDEKKASLTVEAKKFKFESGEEVAIPRGRSEMIGPTTITPIAPTVPAVTPKPISAAEPTEPSRIPVASSKLVQVPMTLVSKTMGDKEVPLVESAGVAPKQKQELILARPQTQSSVEYVVNTNRAMRSLISDILASPGLNDAFGLGGETLSKIPGSPAADVRGKLERLGGNLFIEAITALRNASKTGAGVGNATEKEGDKLERSKANLQQFQTAKAARTELERLLKSLEETETNVLNAYERTYGKGSFQFSPVQTQESKAKRPPLSNIFGTPPQ